MSLLEPDVALTDFALTIECAAFVVWLWRRSEASLPLRAGFIALFAGVGLAALLGGITHGFLPDHRSWLYRALWHGTLVAVGIAALGSWTAGAHLCLPEWAARRVTALASLVFAAYLAVVLFVSQSFTVAIVHYLPAAAFLLLAFVLAWRRSRNPYLLAGIAGIVLTFVAASVQQGGVGLNPRLFRPQRALPPHPGVGALSDLLWPRVGSCTAPRPGGHREWDQAWVVAGPAVASKPRAEAPVKFLRGRVDTRRASYIGRISRPGRRPAAQQRIGSMQTVVIVIHLMLVIAMIGVVLLQKSEGGGLGIGSTGGFMSSRGTANVLTRTTAFLAAGFFATSLMLSILAGIERKPSSALKTDTPSSSAPTGGVLDTLRDQEKPPPGPLAGAAIAVRGDIDRGPGNRPFTFCEGHAVRGMAN